MFATYGNSESIPPKTKRKKTVGTYFRFFFAFLPNERRHRRWRLCHSPPLPSPPLPSPPLLLFDFVLLACACTTLTTTSDRSRRSQCLSSFVSAPWSLPPPPPRLGRPISCLLCPLDTQQETTKRILSTVLHLPPSLPLPPPPYVLRRLQIIAHNSGKIFFFLKKSV